MVHNRAMALLFSHMDHIGKGKGYSQCLLQLPPAAERAPDYTLLRWHREQICWCGEPFDERERGNKLMFAPGTSADSNILKIYGMLDRTNGDKHYYQVFHAEVSLNVV